MKSITMLPEFAKRNNIEAHDCVINDELVANIRNFFKRERAAQALDIRVTLYFNDYDPVDGYIIVYRNGKFIVSTMSLTEM